VVRASKFCSELWIAAVAPINQYIKPTTFNICPLDHETNYKNELHCSRAAPEGGCARAHCEHLSTLPNTTHIIPRASEQTLCGTLETAATYAADSGKLSML
jgi:hypothetical protein